MGKIEILNLDVVAENILDLYDEERRVGDTSLVVIRELLEKWSYEKYELFVKFGRKLMIESEEEVSLSTGIEDSFVESAAAAAYKHRKKAENCQGEEETKEYLMFNLLNVFEDLNEKYITNILENRAFSEKRDLQLFLGFISKYTVVETTPLNMEKAMKQSKLTRQVAWAIKDTGGLCRVPEWYDKESGERKIKDHIQFISLFPDCFNNALSEVKQNVITVPKKSKFVMSIHPYDFVTMSFNTLGWKSCFHPSGDYAHSALSVMVDDTTMITYVPSESFEPNPTPCFINNKRFRAMVHFDDTFKAVLLNKVYPSNLKSYKEMTVNAINRADILGARIQIAERANWDTDVSSSVYDDTSSGSGFLMVHKEHDLDFRTLSFGVGRDMPCMSCGQLSEHGEDGEWHCSSCRGEEEESDYYCERCGEGFSFQESCETGDIFHCQYCLEETNLEGCSCDRCQEKRLEREDKQLELLEFSDHLKTVEQDFIAWKESRSINLLEGGEMETNLLSLRDRVRELKEELLELS